MGNKPTYRDDIYRWLITLETGNPVEIAKVCKPRNRDRFLQVLKDFIAYGDGEVLGFGLEIGSDYRTFRKITTALPLKMK